MIKKTKSNKQYPALPSIEDNPFARMKKVYQRVFNIDEGGKETFYDKELSLSDLDNEVLLLVLKYAERHQQNIGSVLKMYSESMDVRSLCDESFEVWISHTDMLEATVGRICTLYDEIATRNRARRIQSALLNM